MNYKSKLSRFIRSLLFPDCERKLDSSWLQQYWYFTFRTSETDSNFADINSRWKYQIRKRRTFKKKSVTRTYEIRERYEIFWRKNKGKENYERCRVVGREKRGDKEEDLKFDLLRAPIIVVATTT